MFADEHEHPRLLTGVADEPYATGLSQPSSPAPSIQDLSDDPRVVVVRQERTTGHAGVSNAAVQRARGEWITWVDSGDVVDPPYVQRLLELGVHSRAFVLVRVARAERVAFLSEAHYEYRLHAGSVTGTVRDIVRRGSSPLAPGAGARFERGAQISSPSQIPARARARHSTIMPIPWAAARLQRRCSSSRPVSTNAVLNVE